MRIAQLAEHLTLNQGVQGSNPWWACRYRFVDVGAMGLVLFCYKNP